MQPSVLTTSDVDSVSQQARVGHGPSLDQIPTGFHGASATQCITFPTVGGSDPRRLLVQGQGGEWISFLAVLTSSCPKPKGRTHQPIHS